MDSVHVVTANQPFRDKNVWSEPIERRAREMRLEWSSSCSTFWGIMELMNSFVRELGTAAAPGEKK